MDKTAQTLQRETKKWLKRLEAQSLEPKDPSKAVKEQITNIKAYMSDCRHFLEKEDYVHAFEAVIYAWGILETCQRLGVIK